MRKTYAALGLALLVGSSACYGPFNLTRKLHKWNGDVGGKWVNEAVFLGLVFLPAYTFSVLGDAIIFNSVEFWTGKNPVNMAKEVKSIQRGEQQAVLTYTAGEKKLRVDSFEKGRHVSTLIFEPAAEGMAAKDADGNVLMTARTEDGLVVLSDAAGRETGRYHPSQIEEMKP